MQQIPADSTTLNTWKFSAFRQCMQGQIPEVWRTSWSLRSKDRCHSKLAAPKYLWTQMEPLKSFKLMRKPLRSCRSKSQNQCSPDPGPVKARGGGQRPSWLATILARNGKPTGGVRYLSSTGKLHMDTMCMCFLCIQDVFTVYVLYDFLLWVASLEPIIVEDLEIIPWQTQDSLSDGQQVYKCEELRRVSLTATRLLFKLLES